MPILVQLSPEKEARLTTEAVLRGIAPEQYAGELLDEALTPHSARAGALSSQEFHAMLRELAEGSETLPTLPTSAFSRESIYEDHP
jgi:hypothetical protein